tara:strand:- start:929 stop:1528 length:600 start_codon:yes stop_codon:yes gene_type:complete
MRGNTKKRKTRGPSRIKKKQAPPQQDAPQSLKENPLTVMALEILKNPSRLNEEVTQLLATTDLGIRMMMAGIAHNTGGTLNNLVMQLSVLEKEIGSEDFQKDLSKTQKMQLYKNLRDTLGQKLGILRDTRDMVQLADIQDEVTHALKQARGTQEQIIETDHHDVSSRDTAMEKDILVDLRNLLEQTTFSQRRMLPEETE